MSQPHARPAAAACPRFTAVALQTPETADTFRMTAVRVEDGAPAERAEAATPETAETWLSAWISDHPVVLHDLSILDHSGLWRGAPVDGNPPTDLKCFELRQLSRILIPRLRDHSLPSITACLGIEQDGDEAGRLAQAFLKLLDLLYTQELEAVRNLARLTQDTGSPLYDLFLEAEAHLIRHAFSKPDRPALQDDQLIPSCNVSGAGAIDDAAWADAADDGFFVALDEDEIAAMFERKGVFSRTMARYEHRPQQIAMARRVTQAFNDGACLIAEAGTGTGKSLSYLVPAIRWALQNDQRVIVSTNTKNLQEQLFFKDIPFLRDTLRLDFRAALLKGRSNYLCLDRWRAVMAQPGDHLSPREREDALPLVVWAHETKTGDISENSGFPAGANYSLWQKINAEGGACPRCAFQDACFVNRARNAAALSHLVIINHALLFSDLAADNAVLSGYAHLIIDEAHNLEKVAVQHMTIEVGVWRIRTWLRTLYAREGVPTGLLATLRWRVERSPMKQAWKDALAAGVRQGMDAVIALERAAEAFFEAINEEALAVAPENAGAYAPKFRFQAGSPFAGFLAGQATRLQQDFIRLRDALGRLGAVIDEIPASWLADRDEFINAITAGLDTCKTIEDDLAAILKADDPAVVYWIEASRDGPDRCLLVAAPLNVADRLYHTLFSRMRATMLTSATLAVGKRFDYIAGRLGLDRLEAGRLHTFRADSPFDYREQALVCVPATFPTPRMDAFQQAVSALVQGLVLATRRSTLVLFTAYGMLNRTFAEIEQPLGASGVPVFAQGISGPRSSILDAFRRTPGSVLLGTDSFWEGIDVPGEALEIVVLVKLPFAVPTEPVVQAQVEQLDHAGRNSFLEYLVPEAVIKFRQGFGRLIRSAQDRGAVVILDHRVIGTRYGQVFLDSLPTRHRVFRDADALVDGVARWFEQRICE